MSENTNGDEKGFIILHRISAQAYFYFLLGSSNP